MKHYHDYKNLKIMNILSNLKLSAGIFGSFTSGITATAVYILLGIVVATVCYFVIDFLIPGKLSKQITEEKNLPVTIVAGALILGICLIVAASILK